MSVHRREFPHTLDRLACPIGGIAAVILALASVGGVWASSPTLPKPPPRPAPPTCAGCIPPSGGFAAPWYPVSPASGSGNLGPGGALFGGQP